MKYIIICMLSLIAIALAQTGVDMPVPTAAPATTGAETGVTPPAATGAETAVTPPAATGAETAVTPPAATGTETAVTPPAATGMETAVTPPAATGAQTVAPPATTGTETAVVPPSGTGTIVPPSGTGATGEVPPTTTGTLPSGTGTPAAGACNASDISALDSSCQEVVGLFQTLDPGAAIFPGIGLPSQNNGVCTITHTMGPSAPKLQINGLVSNSPLSNNALYSFECASTEDGSVSSWLNLYEVMVGDHRNTNGLRSAGQTYINTLSANGLDVTATHYHWTGANLAGESFVIAVHHQNVGLPPREFYQKTGHALQTYMNATMPVMPPANTTMPAV